MTRLEMPVKPAKEHPVGTTRVWAMVVAFVLVVGNFEQAKQEIVNGAQRLATEEVKVLPLDQKEANLTEATLPNLLLIGVQKGGSTAIADWLFANGVCGGNAPMFRPTGKRRHPVKEMHYFDDDEEREKEELLRLYGKESLFAFGPEAYKSKYKHCYQQKKQVIMDGTPASFLYPDRVFDAYKDHTNFKSLKILISIREPITRELSMFNMQKKVWFDPKRRGRLQRYVQHAGNNTLKTLGEFVESVTLPDLHHNPNQKSYMGYYARTLKRWFQLFDPQQILVLSYEDVKTNQGAKQRIRDFLNYSMPTERLFPKSNTVHGHWKTKAIPCSVTERLDTVFGPWNEELYELLASHPRPQMEEQPFPKFVTPNCIPDHQLAVHCKNQTQSGTSFCVYDR